ISKDGKSVVYQVSTPSITEDKSSTKFYTISLQGGAPREIASASELVNDHNLSPDGKLMISAEDVKLMKVSGKDFYPELQKSNTQIYESLNYRHWDEWEDGA